jgi:hypothetical protein
MFVVLLKNILVLESITRKVHYLKRWKGWMSATPHFSRNQTTTQGGLHPSMLRSMSSLWAVPFMIMHAKCPMTRCLTSATLYHEPSHHHHIIIITSSSSLVRPLFGKGPGFHKSHQQTRSSDTSRMQAAVAGWMASKAIFALAVGIPRASRTRAEFSA